MTTTTESLARRGIEAVDAGELPHGNDVSPAIRQLVDWLHQARWSSPRARASGLRRLVVAARGSRGVVDDGQFSRRVARLAIQWCVPAALQALAQCHEGARRARMLQAAALCEREPTRNNALQARAAYADCAASYANLGIPAADVACYADFATAYAAAAARAAEAAVDTAAYAARATAYGTDADAAAHTANAAYYAGAAATYAAYAARYAADAACTAAYAGNSAPNDVAARAAYDDALAAFAERVARVLIDLNSPGAACLTDCDGRHKSGN